jgi:peptidoglycan/LPS O-acetylase OafA/YrhL
MSQPSAAIAAPGSLGHRRWLDGMRGVAIILVLLYHVFLIPGGFLGVDVFFVVSGFLITTVLAEEWRRRGAISLRRFYWRRALRLFPALVALLLASYLYAEVFLPREAVRAFRRELLVCAAYVSNWVHLHGVSVLTLGHTWSLALEEQFYVLWPLALLLMLRLRLSRPLILAVVAAGVVASVTVRLVLFRLHRLRHLTWPEDTAGLLRLYMGLDTRADALLVGCFLGLLFAWGLLPQSRNFRLASGAVALAGAGLVAHLSLTGNMGLHLLYYGGFTLVALAVAAAIAHLLAGGRWAAAALGFGPLPWIGRISYSLYLVHVPVIAWVRPDWLCNPAALGRGHLGNTLIALGLMFAAAVVSYYGIERPFLRLKDRLAEPRRQRVAAATPRRPAVPSRMVPA